MIAEDVQALRGAAKAWLDQQVTWRCWGALIAAFQFHAGNTFDWWDFLDAMADMMTAHCHQQAEIRRQNDYLTVFMDRVEAHLADMGA